jgi:hypothetical protein
MMAREAKQHMRRHHPSARVPTVRLFVPGLALALAFLWGASGCTGVIYDPGNRNEQDAPDAGAEIDAGDDPEPDAELPPDPCDGVDCSGVGTCVDVGGEVACDCPIGYHAEGLSCVEDPPPDPCDGVVCGANASCDNGTCVCDAGYEGDPVAGCDPISTEEELARAELVSIASAELGKCEGVDDEPYMMGQPGYWCYDFVAWVYQQSSWSLPSPLSLPRHQVGSLPAGWRPEPGDLIKFTIQHYGMVSEVSADGQTITTIEGNVNSCVMTRHTSDPSVEYYGTLDSVFP